MLAIKGLLASRLAIAPTQQNLPVSEHTAIASNSAGEQLRNGFQHQHAGLKTSLKSSFLSIWLLSEAGLFGCKAAELFSIQCTNISQVQAPNY